MNQTARFRIKDLLIFLPIFLAILQLPGRVAFNNHDSGSQAAYDYWTLHHMQYGLDVMQNVGPLGFISYPTLYDGFLDWPKLLLNISLTGLFVTLVIFISKSFPNKISQWIFYTAVILFSAPPFDKMYMTADVQLYALALLIAYALTTLESFFGVSCLVAILALLSLGKGTNLFIALAIVLYTTVHHLAHKRFGMALLAPVVYGASFISYWVLLGQNLVNLPAFLTATVMFSHGYSEAMVKDGKFHIFAKAFVAALCAAIGVARVIIPTVRSLSLANRVSLFGLMTVELFILFVTYKHGFVRASFLHFTVFFQFLSIAAVPFLCFFPTLSTSAIVFDRKQIALLSLLIILCWTASAPEKRMWNNIARIKDNVLGDVRIVLNSDEQVKKLDAELQKSIANMQLPRTNAITEGQQVGYFGAFPGPMIYNRFLYRPMPATISFAAWSGWVIEKDASFFREDSLAPPYLLYTAYTIDHGLFPQDDSLAQLEIFQHYDPLFVEYTNEYTNSPAGTLSTLQESDWEPYMFGHVLLKRRNVTQPLHYDPVGEEKKYPLNSWIDAPADSSKPVWMIIRFPHDIVSTVFSTLFRPSQYEIEYKLANGTIQKNRFITSMAEKGLLIAPLVMTNDQLLAAYSHDEYNAYQANNSTVLNRIQTFRINCIESLICAKKMYVSFEVVQGLEFGRIETKNK